MLGERGMWRCRLLALGRLPEVKRSLGSQPGCGAGALGSVLTMGIASGAIQVPSVGSGSKTLQTSNKSGK